MNVPLKTEKSSLAGCVESTVIMSAGFSFTCLNMVCGNLDTQETSGIALFAAVYKRKFTEAVFLTFRTRSVLN